MTPYKEPSLWWRVWTPNRKKPTLNTPKSLKFDQNQDTDAVISPSNVNLQTPVSSTPIPIASVTSVEKKALTKTDFFNSCQQKNRVTKIASHKVENQIHNCINKENFNFSLEQFGQEIYSVQKQGKLLSEAQIIRVQTLLSCIFSISQNEETLDNPVCKSLKNTENIWSYEPLNGNKLNSHAYPWGDYFNYVLDRNDEINKAPTSTQVLAAPVPSPPESNVLKATDNLLDYLKKQKVSGNSDSIEKLIKKFEQDNDALKKIFDACVGNNIDKILEICSKT